MKTLQNGSHNPHQACKHGDETAGIIFAEAYEGIFGAGLLARTITNRPKNEDRIRGFA